MAIKITALILSVLLLIAMSTVALKLKQAADNLEQYIQTTHVKAPQP